jgi:hypothetical protein
MRPGSVFESGGSAWTLLIIYFLDFLVICIVRPFRDIFVQLVAFINGGSRVAMLALMVTHIQVGSSFISTVQIFIH